MSAYEILLRLTFIVASLAGLLSCFCFAKPWLASLKKPITIPALATLCDDEHYAATANTRWSRLLWIPNWWLGTFFFAITLLSALWTNVWLISFAIVFSLGAALCSLILIFGLAARLRTACCMCYVANLASIAIFITWIIAIWQATTPKA